MSDKTHRVQIGDIACIMLHDGPITDVSTTPAHDESLVETIRSRFLNVTEAELNTILANPPDVAALGPSMNALYIESAGQHILVDTGMGNTAGPALGHITTGLQAEGIEAIDIDQVFITHLHGDHYKGLLLDDGALRYPNSRLIMAQTEWDYWMSDATLEAVGEELAADLRQTFKPLRDRLHFLSAGDTLAPGITLVDLPGHTPGHMGLLIESNGERLLNVGDLLHRVLQLSYPHWQHIWDTDGPLAVQSRKAALARAADEHLLTLFYHLPFPGLGHVARVGDAFGFQPV